jgi:STE24 endopeptidase
VVFILIQGIFDQLRGIGNSLYTNFVIKERYGFNKMDLKTFRSDLIKNWFLVVIIGGPFYYGMMWIIKNGGPNFYIYLSGFTVLVLILMFMLIPNVIMPLFNKYTELEDLELKKRIEALARSMDFPLKKIYVMDASKRTAHSNAFYYGFGANKRIVLFDTLLK